MVGVQALIRFRSCLRAQGQARIRTQISAGHEIHHLDKALDAFTKVGKKFNILGKTKQQIIEMYGV